MKIVRNFTSKDEAARWYEYGVVYETDEELAAVPLFQEYPEPLLIFASACCVIFMLIGIPGNLTTIIALARCKKVRNATSIFIINLHVSDLIFCCLIHPMTAMTFAQKHWTHGLIMCRVYPMFKYMLNGTSIFTILAISINRYVMVCHPLLYPRLYTRRNLSIKILAIWLSAFALFLSSTFGTWGRYDLEPNGGFCTMLKDKHNRSPKKLFVIVAFVGPYLTIVLCYARIWWVVRKSTMIQQAKNAPQNRPTHLPISATQSKVANKSNRFIRFLEPTSTSGNSITDDERDSSAATSPNDDINVVKFFKAPFRLTRKEVRPKLPTSRDKKLCTMIGAIMISFCVSHLPIMATKMAYKEYKSEPIANVFSHLLEYMGTCINPIIYVLMSKEYRQAYKSLYETAIKKIQRH